VLVWRSSAGDPGVEGSNGLGPHPWFSLTDDFGVDQRHGTNAFIHEGDRTYQTFFVQDCGDAQMGGTWSYLDITALGCPEEWEDSPDGHQQTPPYPWWSLPRRVRDRPLVRHRLDRRRPNSPQEKQWTVRLRSVILEPPAGGPARQRLRGCNMSVYKVVEIIGTSSESWEGAAVAAVDKARESIRQLRVAEVVEQDLDLDDNGGVTFRTKLRLSFKYEDEK